MEQPGPTGKSPSYVLAGIEGELSVQYEAAAAIKTELDASLHRENVGRLERAADEVVRIVQSSIVDQLQGGAILSFGFIDPSSEMILVPPSHWAFLEIDWPAGRANGHGLSYFGLRFVPTTLIDEAREYLPLRYREILRRPAAEGLDGSTSVDRYKTGAPGRPTSRALVEAEREKRAQAGVTCGTLREESAELEAWLRETHPRAPSMTARTIENVIRAAFNSQKAGAQNHTDTSTE